MPDELSIKSLLSNLKRWLRRPINWIEGVNTPTVRIIRAGILIVGIAAFVAGFWKFKMVEYVNSDNAWYAMIGREIRNGNFFLEGWTGSTLPHTIPYGYVEAIAALFFDNYQQAHIFALLLLITLSGCILYYATNVLALRDVTVKSKRCWGGDNYLVFVNHLY